MFENRSPLSIEEELYCTRYELEILSGIVTQGMLERWVPGYCSVNTHKEHVSRYEWAKQFVTNNRILDIACGTGYGSYMMASEGSAASITACDIDPKTVKYASFRNRHTAIDFQVGNAESFVFDKKFDVVISFETIEHLSRPDAFLSNVRTVLDTNGTFIVSTPISDQVQNNKPHNIYHTVEWGFERFQELVSKHFEITDIMLQVYRFPPKPDNRLVARGFRKAGIAKKEKVSFVERITPFKWDSQDIQKEAIGTEWTGYQIVKCKHK